MKFWNGFKNRILLKQCFRFKKQKQKQTISAELQDVTTISIDCIVLQTEIFK